MSVMISATHLRQRVRETPARLWWILAVSVILRVVTAVYLGSDVSALPGTADQSSYHMLATRLVTGHGLTFPHLWWPMTPAEAPTAHWSYLYTAYLAAFYGILGAVPLWPRIVQAVVVGVAQPALTYWIANRCFGRRAAVAAAAVAAGYAYFIYYAATLMTEPFYITGILASLAIAMRLADVPPSQGAGTEGPSRAAQPAEPRRGVSAPLLGWAVALGIAVVFTALLRQVFLLMLPLILAWIVAARPAGRRRAILPALGLTLVVTALLILPITLFNYSRFKTVVLLNTNAGFAFFWANHPIHGTDFYDILPARLGSYQDLIPEDLRSLNEAELDRALLTRGIGFVRQDPVRYVLLSMSRIPDYFKFWPEASSSRISNISRVLSFGAALPFMLLGIVLALRGLAFGSGLERRRSADVALLLVFSAAYTTVHLASWALIRYRLPVDAVMMPFAGLGIIAVAERIGLGRVAEAPPAIASAEA